MQHTQGGERDPMLIKDTKTGLPLLSAIPSGSELPEAIIDAKDIESVSQLISKINNNSISIENIYNKLSRVNDQENKQCNSPVVTSEQFEGAGAVPSQPVEENTSINSEKDVHPVVDKAYEILLNMADKVRFNK